MTPLVDHLLNSLVLTGITMTVLWLTSLLRRDASIVDPFWGTGFVLITWLTFAAMASDHTSGRSWLA
jgi:steroid 5-alpha reductase family enzyme